MKKTNAKTTKQKTPLSKSKEKDFSVDNERYVTATALARLAGVAVPTVTQNKTLAAIRLKGGKWDLHHTEVKAYIEGKRIYNENMRNVAAAKKSGANGYKPYNSGKKSPNGGENTEKSTKSTKKSDFDPPEPPSSRFSPSPDDFDYTPSIDDPLAAKQQQKLVEAIELSKERRRKLQLENLEKAKSLIPNRLIYVWMGVFNKALGDNLRPIGVRVSQGDRRLAELIDSEVFDAYKRALEVAKEKLRNIDVSDYADLDELVQLRER